MTLTSQVIVADEIDRRGDFIEMSIGLPWFRSLRMSHIIGLTASADQGPASPIEMLINGNWHNVAALGQLTDLEWYPQDRQTIRFVEPRQQFELYLSFELLMPNLFMGPQHPVVITTSAKQAVAVAS